MGVKWILITLLLVIIIGAASAFGGYTYGHAAGLTAAQNIRSDFFASRGVTGQAGAGAAGTGAFTGGQGAGQGAAQGTGQGSARQANGANFANGQVKTVS